MTQEQRDNIEKAYEKSGKEFNDNIKKLTDVFDKEVDDIYGDLMVNKILSDNINLYLTGNCTLYEASDRVCNSLEELIERKVMIKDISKENISNAYAKVLTSWINGETSYDNHIHNMCKLFDYIAEENTNKYTINDLKKKIKHSKNPMELKMLNKQLNELYKAKKGR